MRQRRAGADISIAPAAPAERVQKRKLYQDVMDLLLAHIREDGRKPGDPLPSERELMERYQVGRPAIREAMQNLARVGVITIQHGGRARIAEPSMSVAIDQMSLAARHVLSNSPSSLAHLKDARLTFELEMARRAAASGDKAGVDLLRGRLAEQRAAVPDRRRFLAADGAFHLQIAAMAGNPIFEAVSAAMFGWLSDFHVSLVHAPGLERVTLREHEGILDAIASSNMERAVEAMRAHLERADELYRIHDVGSASNS